MSRRGVFGVAALLGGLLVWLQPWWLGALLLGWAGWKAWRFAAPLIVVSATVGLAVGWQAHRLAAAPPQPVGAVRVMPTAWTFYEGLARYTGVAANGVPISGSVTVTPAQIDQLRQLTVPVAVQWQGPLTRITGARNEFEFDYAQYVWAQTRLAYQSPKQALVMRVARVRTLSEWLHGLRARFLLHLQTLPSKVRAYAKGLLLGQLDEDFDSQRQTFVDLGIFHLFSVSGLHLFALIGSLYALTDRLRLPKEAVDWGLVAALPTLLVLIPPGAGIMRAVYLRLALILNERLKWQLSRLDCFSAVLGLNLIIQPLVLHTFGGQLTYLLTGVLMLAPAPTRWGTTWRLAAVSAPVVLANTFRLHLLTSVFNWLLMPVFELGIMPALVIVCLWPQSPLTGWLEWGLRWGEAGLTGASHLPGQVIFGALPSGLAVLGVGLILGALVHRRWRLVGVWLVGSWLVVNVHPQWRVTVFDVGQGDAILIEAPFKQGTLLIDTGGRGFGTTRNPPVKSAIVNYLHARGVARLDALALTHADADHVGDAGLLTQLMPVTTLYTTPLAADHPYVVAAKAGQVTQARTVLAGAVLAVKAIQLRVVAPAAATASEKNADSLVVYGKIGDSNWLFTGDADVGVETRELMPQHLTVDYLKVGHHGSGTSSAPAFIAQIQPTLALISAGVANRYGHPHPETLATFAAQGVPWLVTAERGMIWREGTTLHTFLKGP
ncbi:ComEC/Rec2 family competence protein [Lacticaseibacillus daqingensis]|uniref:ComEC/Rec2 family competence protein n=1 Tax=Lacticaseibacillus daqingensis TaxID=2486014 RepID=UPI000F7AC94B|nr:ComEC/Rec2 family competence protein [Lacticaseibacillus daqingensis]